MNDEQQDLSPDARKVLGEMKQDRQPPARIEQAILHTLRQEGLVTVRHAWPWPVIATAAVVVIVLAAWLGAQWQSRRMPVAHTHLAQSRFVILLYAGDSAANADGMTQRDEYAAWAQRLAAQGTTISGEELEETGVDIPEGSMTAQTLVQPRGYFVIGARDASDARAIAATCPHLRHGGRIVVRRIVS
jgi:hypothetical protein